MRKRAVRASRAGSPVGLAMGLLLALLSTMVLTTSLPAQAEGAEGGTAAVTIPAAAVIAGIEEGVLETPSGAPGEGRHIEVRVRVRANTAYRVTAVLTVDAPAGVRLAVEGDPDLREIRPGVAWLVATGSGPGEQTHRLRVWIPPGQTAGRPVELRVERLASGTL
jgi:hypothetical protein